MISRQVFYEGRVQGVGFRYTVKQIARGFDITGSVKNLADGRVEVQASGAEGEVRGFVDAIAESELRAHIRKQTEGSVAPAQTAPRGFQITHD